MSLDAAEHVPGPGVDGDDCLVPVIVLVDETIRLYRGLELQIHAVDGNVVFVSNESGIDLSIEAGSEKVVITRSIVTSSSSPLDGHKGLVGQSP